MERVRWFESYSGDCDLEGGCLVGMGDILRLSSRKYSRVGDRKIDCSDGVREELFSFCGTEVFEPKVSPSLFPGTGVELVDLSSS